MGNFQNIVMIVAVVILIVSLIIIGIMIWDDKYKNLFPPVLPGCPQPGWAVDMNASDDNPMCVPSGGIQIPNSNCQSIPYISGDTDTDICVAYNTAKACNIPWDGISGNPQYKKQCKE